MTVGPVFTEEMWRLACCALQDAFSATLEPVKVQIRRRGEGETEGGATQMEGLSLNRHSHNPHPPGGDRRNLLLMLSACLDVPSEPHGRGVLCGTKLCRFKPEMGRTFWNQIQIHNTNVLDPSGPPYCEE